MHYNVMEVTYCFQCWSTIPWMYTCKGGSVGEAGRAWALPHFSDPVNSHTINATHNCNCACNFNFTGYLQHSKLLPNNRNTLIEQSQECMHVDTV